MARDTGIAARLRDAGLRVVEVAGWQTRGSATFNPRGSVNHHTAGAATGNAPSLTTCIYGRPGLPGPLCQVLMARDLTCYVIAAGRANHAGAGSWAGLTGNTSVWGLEIEHSGYGPSGAQLRAAVRVHAALLGPRGNAGLVCQHSEWAPTRKIDFRSLAPDYTAAGFRNAIASALHRPAPRPPATPGGFLMSLTAAQQKALYDRVMSLPGNAAVDMLVQDGIRKAIGSPKGKDGHAAPQARARARDGAREALGDLPDRVDRLEKALARIEQKLASP